MAAWRRAWRVRSPLVGLPEFGIFAGFAGLSGSSDGTESGRRSRVDGATGAVDAAGRLPAAGDRATAEDARFEQRGEQRPQGPVAHGGAAGGAVDGFPGRPGWEADG